jgi:hypothetical protein
MIGLTAGPTGATGPSGHVWPHAYAKVTVGSAILAAECNSCDIFYRAMQYIFLRISIRGPKTPKDAILTLA